MEELVKLLQAQFNKMCATGKLFRVKTTGREVWDRYLKSFDAKDNPIFRDPESSSHNCNHCKNFIRRYGNIVAINDKGLLMTIFDVEKEPQEYQNSMVMCAALVGQSEIENVFFETFQELQELPYESCKRNNSIFKLGVAKNHKKYTKEEVEKYGVVKEDKIYTFSHFNLDLPKQFVDFSGKSVEAIMGEYRDKYSVFKRGIIEISLDTLNLVKDLINQGSLLDGTAHIKTIEEFILLKKEYEQKETNNNWFWEKSYTIPERLAKFKNTLIGVLCTELSEGEELNKACQSWNKRVDPANYMKAKAPITQKQIKEAKKFIESNGYEESFIRRFATIDDIKVSEILHSNVGDGDIKSVSIFDGVKANSTRHKRNQFDNVEEISIDKFMKDILPSCTSIEALLEGKHEGNLVSLTTANNKDSKPIFKWDNNYSWTYNGNLAGKSQIKEAVKTAGGKVDGVLRFSLMWAENNGDNSDLDAHCNEPNNNKIYFSSKVSRYTGGQLDIDITDPKRQMPSGAVENIVYPSLERMDNGKYLFRVHQYSASNSQGFKAEIEFNGEQYYYEYNNPVQGYIDVAVVTLNKGEFTIEHKLPETNIDREIYGLDTNQFHKVNLVCLSPNHWGNNRAGNKHYFFMLDGCKAKSSIRSFHNENLIPELLKHRKVTEVLANNTMIEPDNKQLSGLGFNATVKDELVLKIQGTHKRMVKIKF